VRETGNKDMLEAYLVKYPNGQFSDLANIMIANLLKPGPHLRSIERCILEIARLATTHTKNPSGPVARDRNTSPSRPH
jgi:hypothetical protein